MRMTATPFKTTTSPHPADRTAPAAGSSRAPRPRQDRPAERRAKGVVQLNPRGFGFVQDEDGVQAYFLSHNLTRGLMDYDQVEVQVRQSFGKGEPKLDVSRVISLQRAARSQLGIAREEEGVLHFHPDGPCGVPLQLAPGTKIPAGQESDVMQVDVPAYGGPVSYAPVLCTLRKMIGPRSCPTFLHDYVGAKFGFQDEADGEHLLSKDPYAAQALSLLASLERAHQRGDKVRGLRPQAFVTIDGESTKDFDDAVWVSRTPEGWQVHVAISDVSHFIKPGSAMDLEAKRRGTSVYLGGKVLPMLPSVISQGACSLKVNLPRYAVIMALELNEQGKLMRSEISRGVICVHAQLSYNQVAKSMCTGLMPCENMDGEPLENTLAVQENVRALGELYPLLKAARVQKELLDVEEPDLVPVQQPDGRWGLEVHHRNDAHKLVEELMLLANVTAAQHLLQQLGYGIFRHQQPPTGQAWRELQEWVAASGYGALPDSPSIQELRRLVDGADSEAVRANLLMKARSAMVPAAYVAQRAGEAMGHFSLDYPWYTHFSSPIRRYADLVVHRLLLSEKAGSFEEVADQARDCAKQALAAKMGERYFVDQVKLKALKEQAPSKLEAQVLRHTGRGLRVLVQPHQCAGWLLAPSLLEAGYTWDVDTWRPVGTQKSLACGTLFDVAFDSINEDMPGFAELQVVLKTGGE